MSKPSLEEFCERFAKANSLWRLPALCLRHEAEMAYKDRYGLAAYEQELAKDGRASRACRQ